MPERSAPRLVPAPRPPRPSLDLAALLGLLEPALSAAGDALADRVVERLASSRPSERAATFDRRELATHLGVCVDTVDKLRAQGMPVLMVVDSPRFELDRVLEWLRGRK